MITPRSWAANAQRPDLRIGDAEREAAASALGEHYAAGRLTRDELDERSTRVYASRTNSDLWPLFTDLPPTGKEPWAQAAGVRRREPPRADSRTRSQASWAGGWWTAGAAPVILVVIALVVLVHLPWPILLLVGWIWWGRTFRHWSRGHARGSRRSARGTWA